MSHRSLVSAGLVALAIAVAPLAWGTVAGQSQSSTITASPVPRDWKIPRTPDGKPDLQGVWDYRSITPLERATELGDKAVYNDDEAKEVDARARARNQDNRAGVGTDADVSRAYNDFWWDFGRELTTKRTSLIVDPPNGRIPALTPEAQARGVGRGGGGAGPSEAAPNAAAPNAAAPAGGRGGGGGQRIPASWLDRGMWERCLTYGGVPRLSGAYNNNFQLFQSGDTVVILYEMIHEARIIPLDRPHGTVRQWLGDSRGRWEGDTLVVDTINFTDKVGFRGSNVNLHLVERFARSGPDTFMYQFTVEDPTVWTRPWTAELPVRRNPEPIYEYACHEGNYGMFGILSGARAQEKAIADAAQKGSR